MYSHVHGVIGAVTYTATYAATGSHIAAASVSFVTHFLADYLGETGYGTDKLFYFHKKGQVSYFSCHNHPGWKIGKHRIGIFSFNDRKLGVPVRIKFDRDETVALGVIATAILTIWTYILKIGWVL